MNTCKISKLLLSEDNQELVSVNGWVRTARGNKSIKFIHLNDGSTIDNLQIVADTNVFGEEFLKKITTGTCINVVGKLIKSQGKEQNIEIQADKIKIWGLADPQTYPLQKKGHSFEYLRDVAHLRPRTNVFGAIFRIRHHIAFAIHKYFNDKGFYYFHTPIITASDAEGAGAMFNVTTLQSKHIVKNGAKLDYSNDFFEQETNLTVSGQLEGELGALSLGAIYTFGPTFRAENSNTPRHLAEFWMVEPEVAFNDLNDNMDLAEDFLKYLVKYALEYCIRDLTFLNNTIDNELIDRLNAIGRNNFIRLTYTECIQILEKSDVEFEYPISWGVDLQSEHERYLVENHFKCPVILTDYPKAIKSFYMKQNDDGKTVRAMDVLFPKIGEIIGGSEREDDYNKLLSHMEELGMNTKSIWWYLDSRKFGSAPHSGFGLGFERLILFITGMSNIRDVIPFPRTPKKIDF